MPPPLPEDAVAAVVARAAEIDLHQSPPSPATLLDEEAMVEIGAAVGLSPAAIRQAVAEHHAGALVPAVVAPDTWVGPRVAVAEQRLTGDPDRLRRAVERDLERQWFRKVRDQDGHSVWAARTDLPARVARRVDFRHRLVLDGVSALRLTTVPCGADEVVVRLEADPAERRTTLGWKVAGTTAGGAPPRGAGAPPPPGGGGAPRGGGGARGPPRPAPPPPWGGAPPRPPASVRIHERSIRARARRPPAPWPTRAPRARRARVPRPPAARRARDPRAPRR